MKHPTHQRAYYLTRVRLFGLLSVILSPVWCFAAYRLFKHILHVEFVGIFSGAIRFVEESGGNSPVPLEPNPISVIEGTVHGWLALTCLAGLLLLVAGGLALAGHRSGRKWHLAAGMIILGATAATMVGVFVLIRWGQFPPMRLRDYALVVAVQSGYGWVLLGAFARQPRLGPLKNARSPARRPS